MSVVKVNIVVVVGGGVLFVLVVPRVVWPVVVVVGRGAGVERKRVMEERKEKRCWGVIGHGREVL